jgi:hypothetical protein
MAAGTNALDVYSALNSSPWTAESFGGDPEKAKACKEYVAHSIGLTSFFGLTAAIVGHSWWPVIGTILANMYMYWLYNRALIRAQNRNSTDWDS